MHIETWLKIICDQCGATNWLNNGDVSDQTVSDVEGFQCWGCHYKHNLGEPEDIDEDNIYYEEGLEKPKDYAVLGENMRNNMTPDERKILQELNEAEAKIYSRHRLGNEYTGNLATLNEVAKVSGVQNNWVWGYVGKYWFEAKVFNEGSDFGIEGGRISKLHVKFGGEDARYDGEDVITYDRGWGMKPTKEHKQVLQTLLEALS